MKQKYIDLYMDWAKRLSQLSHARRLKVGAVIVKDDTVISYGYNGMPAGWDNNCEHKVYNTFFAEQQDNSWLDPLTYETADINDWYPFTDESGKRYTLKTNPEVLHAESNAISKLAKSHNSGDGADIFITHSPCIECAKLIYQSGIKRVFYGEHYRSNDGIEFLKKSGVGVSSPEMSEFAKQNK